MGNSSSRLDRFAGTYEKSFERLEKDVERFKGRTAARAKRKASLSRWCTAAVVLAVALAASIIYQVQRQPYGTYTHQQHLQRVGGAMAIPAVAFAARWVLVLFLSLIESRDTRKLKSLEAAKRSMIKELKDMTRFDKIKSLIDKYDPDARRAPSPGQQLTGNRRGNLQASASYPQAGGHQLTQQQQQQRSQQVVPALLMKGSGQVAGAAALAMAGAGKALMPVFDKLATSLISENPMLLEDLRNSKLEALKAMIREGDALLDGCTAKLDSIALKQRLVELELQLDQNPSYNKDALEEQRQQLSNQAADVQRVQEQLHQQLQQHLAQQTVAVAAGTSAEGAAAGAAALAASGSWPGGLAHSDMLTDGSTRPSSSWEGVSAAQAVPAHAISAPDTPCAGEAAAGVVADGSDFAKGAGVLPEQGSAANGGMGEGLDGAVAEQVFTAGAASGIRQRKAAGAGAQ